MCLVSVLVLWNRLNCSIHYNNMGNNSKWCNFLSCYFCEILSVTKLVWHRTASFGEILYNKNNICQKKGDALCPTLLYVAARATKSRHPVDENVGLILKRWRYTRLSVHLKPLVGLGHVVDKFCHVTAGLDVNVLAVLATLLQKLAVDCHVGRTEW